MSSAEYSCKRFKPILCIQANIVDPDETAPQYILSSDDWTIKLMNCRNPKYLEKIGLSEQCRPRSDAT